MAYDVERETGKPDTTPKGPLTWLVRNGQLLDVINGMIMYGVSPKLKVTPALIEHAPDWVELIQYVNTKDDAPPSQSVIDIWKRTESNAVFTAMKNAKPKSRYGLIRTQERNLGKDNLTGQKRGSTLAIAYALWSAHMCKEFINTQQKIMQCDRFTEGQYQGYNGHSVNNRYNVIRTSGSKNWTLQKFNVHESSDSLMKFSDYLCVLFGDNFRKTLPDENLTGAMTQMTKALSVFDRMIRNKWTFKIREPTKFVFQEDDKEDKKSKKQLEQEKYDDSNAILQVMMGMVNDTAAASVDYQAHYKSILKFAENYANDATKFMHTRSTEGMKNQKLLKEKLPGAKSMDDLDYEDGTFEKYSPSTRKTRAKLLTSTEGGYGGINLQDTYEGFSEDEDEDGDDGMLIGDVIGLLNENDIRFNIENESEYDAHVGVAASDEVEFIDLFKGSERLANEEISQLRSEWQCEFIEENSTDNVKRYHILPKGKTNRGKRKAPPETLAGGKKKAGKSKANTTHARETRKKFTDPNPIRSNLTARGDGKPTPKLISPIEMIVKKTAGPQQRIVVEVDLMNESAVRAWYNRNPGEVQKYKDSQHYSVQKMKNQDMMNVYATLMNFMTAPTIYSWWEDCYEGKAPGTKKDAIRDLADFIGNIDK